MAKPPPDSDEQQAQVTAVQDEDGYNWGYNILILLPSLDCQLLPNFSTSFHICLQLAI